jgi:hypothetical protein
MSWRNNLLADSASNGKGKVVPVLQLSITPWRCIGSGGIAPRILYLGTRRRWVVSFMPRAPYPPGRVPGIHWIGGWVGPRAVLDTVVKGKILSPRRESNPRTPIVQLVAESLYRLSYHGPDSTNIHRNLLLIELSLFIYTSREASISRPVYRLCYGLDDRGSIPDRGQWWKFFFSPPRPDLLWGSPNFLLSGYQEFLTRE